jgi:hypothetical protein
MFNSAFWADLAVLPESPFKDVLVLVLFHIEGEAIPDARSALY